MWQHDIKGDQLTYLASLHRRYGPVVRTGPHQLSFADGTSWHDVYGGTSTRCNPKDFRYLPIAQGKAPGIVTAKDGPEPARYVASDDTRT